MANTARIGNPIIAAPRHNPSNVPSWRAAGITRTPAATAATTTPTTAIVCLILFRIPENAPAALHETRCTALSSCGQTESCLHVAHKAKAPEPTGETTAGYRAHHAVHRK